MRRMVVPLHEAATGKLPAPGGGKTYRILRDAAIAGAGHFSPLRNAWLPGAAGSARAHEVEQAFSILGDPGIFTIGGPRLEVGPETAVFVPVGATHQVESLGPEAPRSVTLSAPPGPERDLRARGRQAFGPARA